MSRLLGSLFSGHKLKVCATKKRHFQLEMVLDVSMDVNAVESVHEEVTPWRQKTKFN